MRRYEATVATKDGPEYSDDEKIGTYGPGVAVVRSSEHRLLDGQASGSAWRSVVVRRCGIDRVEFVVDERIDDLRVLPGPGRLLRSRRRPVKGGGGGPRTFRWRFQGGSQRWSWRRTRSMTSCCSGAMAAMIFIGFWQERQRAGSSSQRA
jgi:hypothetical protein